MKSRSMIVPEKESRPAIPGLPDEVRSLMVEVE
jgi:hypothetical protein